jgi:hypothetical protein
LNIPDIAPRGGLLACSCDDSFQAVGKQQFLPVMPRRWMAPALPLASLKMAVRTRASNSATRLAVGWLLPKQVIKR